jgi:hypothetical protein
LKSNQCRKNDGTRNGGKTNFLNNCMRNLCLLFFVAKWEGGKSLVIKQVLNLALHCMAMAWVLQGICGSWEFDTEEHTPARFET